MACIMAYNLNKTIPLLAMGSIVKTGSRYSKQRKRDFKKGDYVQMRSYLENMKWAEILENKTAEQCWESLKSEFDYMIQKFTPIKGSHADD